MTDLSAMTNTSWRRATGAILLGILVWQALWLAAVYLVTDGEEFADDTPAYRMYVEDPGILLSQRHRHVFGAAVAAPLLALELKFFNVLFGWAGDFLAFRITMLLHVWVAMGIGFGVGFKQFGAPNSARRWLQAGLISIVPVSWITSVLIAQDDSIAAAWAGLSLAACVWLGPFSAAIAAGFGMFFGKVLLALTFLALWIGSPRRRVGITMVGTVFVLVLAASLWWRDGGLGEYTSYIYPPYMGSSAYGVVWMLAGEFDLPAARTLSAILTGLALAGFTWLGVRRHLSATSAVVGIHMLFLVTYFGAMPEYYAWFLPFLIVTLWSCCYKRMWGTFALGWLSSFCAYGYKVIYGMNSRFPGGKVGLKSWALEHVPFDMDILQVAIAIAAVVCTLLFGVCVLFLDPTNRLAMVEPKEANA